MAMLNTPGWFIYSHRLAYWLVVWNMFSHSVGDFIIPTDFNSIIFQRGRSTTNRINVYILINIPFIYHSYTVTVHSMLHIGQPATSIVSWKYGSNGPTDWGVSAHFARQEANWISTAFRALAPVPRVVKLQGESGRIQRKPWCLSHKIRWGPISRPIQ